MTSSSETTNKNGATTRSGAGLLKVLGVWFGISAAVGNTIAAGIVRTPGEIAQLLPVPFLFMGVWVLGGLYALCGASSLAELGAAIALSGGQYNYSRRALGDYAGFIVGWSDWLSACGAMAAMSIVVGEYSAKLFPVWSYGEKSISVAALIGFALLQWQGVRWGSGAQLITAAMKTLAFAVLVVACFVAGGHGRVTIATTSLPPLAELNSGWPLVVAIMVGLQAVFYTTDGWDGVIYFGEEVRDPGRDVPRAIFGSVLAVMAIYLLLNAALLYVLPMQEICGNKFALGTATQRIFGPYGDPVIRSIMIISLLSAINANQLFCSRVLYSMSSDGLFFRPMGRVNKGGTPVMALLLSTVVGIAFILGSFERVIAMLSFFFVANYTLSYTSLFILRRKEPQMVRPYLAWGYPWTTGIALFGSLLFLVGSIATDRENAPIALAMLVASYPLFLILKGMSKRAATCTREPHH